MHSGPAALPTALAFALLAACGDGPVGQENARLARTAGSASPFCSEGTGTGGGGSDPTLALTVSVEPERFVGQVLHYQVTVTNTDVVAAADVALSLTFIDGTVRGRVWPTIEPGATQTEVFEVQVPALEPRQPGETFDAYRERYGALNDRQFDATATLAWGQAGAWAYAQSHVRVPDLVVWFGGELSGLPGQEIAPPLDVWNWFSGDARDVAIDLTVDATGETTPALPFDVPQRSYLRLEGPAVVHLPPLMPRQVSESDDDYEARLRALAANPQVALTARSIWYDGNGTLFGDEESLGQAYEVVPFLESGLGASAQVAPGTPLQVWGLLANFSNTDVAQARVHVVFPDGAFADWQVEPQLVAGGWANLPELSSTVADIPVRGATEPEQEYYARLVAQAGKVLYTRAEYSWTDAAGNQYGPLGRTFESTLLLPVVIPSIGAPPEVLPGQSGSVGVTLENVGNHLGVVDVPSAGSLTWVGEGETVQDSLPIQAPSFSDKGPDEGDTEYLARLRAAQQLIELPAAFLWRDFWNWEKPFGEVHRTLQAQEVLPIVVPRLEATVNAAGDQITYVVRLENEGREGAWRVEAVLTLPDGSTVAVGAPDTLAIGEQGTAQVVVAGGTSQALNARVEVRWKDWAWGCYGPLSAAATLGANAAPVVSAGPDQVVALPSVPQAPALSFAPLSAGLSGTGGAAFHEASGGTLVSVNAPSGEPANFELVAADGSRTPYSAVHGLSGRVDLAVAPDDGGGTSAGGFQAGTVYLANEGTPGVIGVLSPDGQAFEPGWVTLPGETAPVAGGLTFDRSGVFGGDLLVATRSGAVWRVSAAGVPTLLAQLPRALAGVVAVPQDAGRFGPWAGKVLASARSQLPAGATGPDPASETVFAVDSAGGATAFDLGIRQAAGLFLVPSSAAVAALDPQAGILLQAPATQVAPLAGDLLVAGEASGSLWRVRWTGSTFQVNQIWDQGSWGAFAFAPAPEPPLADATAQLVGSATDDGLPNPPGQLTLAWTAAAASGTVAFGDPAHATTTAAFATAGGYTLQLWASDSVASTSASTHVTVLPRNRAPEVNAGPDLVAAPGVPVALAGAATDDGLPSGSSLTFAWTLVTGPGVVAFQNPVQLATLATLETPGEYVLELAASDGELTGTSRLRVRQLAALTLALEVPESALPGEILGASLVVTSAGAVPFTSASGQVSLPDGTSVPWSVGPLAAGASALVPLSFTVPALEPRGGVETDAAYLARLLEADARALSWFASGAAIADTGTLTANASAVTVEAVPIVVLKATAPAQLYLFDRDYATVVATNIGHATASSVWRSTVDARGRLTWLPDVPLLPGQWIDHDIPIRGPEDPECGSWSCGPDANLWLATAVDGQPVYIPAIVEWTDTLAGDYGPSTAPTQTIDAEPLLSLEVAAPPSLNPGETVLIQVSSQNLGHAQAVAPQVLVTGALVPGGELRQAWTALDPGLIATSGLTLPVPPLLPRDASQSSLQYWSQLQGWLDPLRFYLTWTDPANNDFVRETQLQGRVPIALASDGFASLAVLPGEPAAAAMILRNDGTTNALDLTFTGPGGEVVHGPASIAPGLAEVAYVPQVPLALLTSKGPSESNATYLGRLSAARDLPEDVVPYEQRWWDPSGNLYGPLDARVLRQLVLPILDHTSPFRAGASSWSPGATVVAHDSVYNSGTDAAIAGTDVLTLDGVTLATLVFAPSLQPSLYNPAASNASAAWTVPLLAAKGASESDGDYLARLAAADGSVQWVVASRSWTDRIGNSYGPVVESAGGMLQVPRVLATGVSVGAPPGGTERVGLHLGSAGSIAPTSVSVSRVLPEGGTVEVPLTPSTGLGTAAVDWPVPLVEPRGATEAEADYRARLRRASGTSAEGVPFLVSWAGAGAARYGPIGATAAPTSLLGIIEEAPPTGLAFLPSEQRTVSMALTNSGNDRLLAPQLLLNQTTAVALPALGPGSSAATQLTLTAPQVAPKGTSETDSDYLRRIDGMWAEWPYELTWSGVGPTRGTIQGRVDVPSLRLTLALSPGGSASLVATITNAGQATASNLALTPFLEGSAASGTEIASLAPGASWSRTYAVAEGPIHATATLTWRDALGGNYGPIRAEVQGTAGIDSTRQYSLVLVPAVAGPNPVGATQSMVAALASYGRALAGETITLRVEGANPEVHQATTDSSGLVHFAYEGGRAGDDTVTASWSAPGGLAVRSLASRIGWESAGSALVASSPARALFFHTIGCTFKAQPGDQPKFELWVPQINFNPPNDVIPGYADNVHLKPMVDAIKGPSGEVERVILAEGNGHATGLGELLEFDAMFAGSLVVKEAGVVTLRILADDGFILGIGNGASRVDGALVNPPADGLTPFDRLPVVAAKNVVSGVSASFATVRFPAAGVYPYELDYTECASGEQVLVFDTQAGAIPPAGSLELAPGGAVSRARGSSLAVAATATFPDGTPAVGAQVTFVATGPNEQTVRSLADANGIAHASLRGTASGTDRVIATAILRGLSVATNDTRVTWIEAPVPTVSAGPDLAAVLPRTATVELRGSAALFATGSLSLLWTQLSGPAASLEAASSAGAVARFEAPGIYRFRLTATVLETSATAADECEVVVVRSALDGATLALAPASQGPVALGGTVDLQAILLDREGAALADAPLSLRVTGTQALSLSAVTDAAGRATFRYAGAQPGLDAAQAFTFADGLEVRSPQARIGWATPALSTMVVSRLRLRAFPSTGPSFDATPALTPAIEQDLAQVLLDPPASLTGSLDLSHARPLQAASLDSLGVLAGTTEVKDGASRAGLDALASYQEVIQGELVTRTAGVYDLVLIYSGQASLGIAGALPVEGTLGSALPFSGLAALPAAAIAGGSSVRVRLEAGTHAIEIDHRPADAGPLTLALLGADGMVVPAPATLALERLSATPLGLGQQAGARVLARDDAGRPLSGLTVRFVLQGASSRLFEAATDASGQATFAWLGQQPGVETARASATLPSGDIGSAALTQEWLANDVLVVNAGAPHELTLPNSSARLSGSVQAPGGVALLWEQVSGPASVTFEAADSAVAVAHFPGPGVYGLRLTATSASASASATTTVTVREQPANNLPPQVDAGPDQSVVWPALATLVGSVSDDGSPGASVTSHWSLDAGPAVVAFADAASPQTTASFPTTGLFVLRLTASDGEASASSIVLVNVQAGAPNLAPMVGAGPDTTLVLPSATLALHGAVADDGLPAGGSVLHLWSLAAGPQAVRFEDPAALPTTVYFSGPGTYRLRLAAFDGELQATDELVVAVLGPPTNAAPQVDAGPHLVLAASTRSALLLGQASDDGLPAGGALRLQWSFVAGASPVRFDDPTLAAATARFAGAGSYLLRLSASDGALTSSADVVVDIPALEGPAPEVELTAPIEGSRITAPTSIGGSVSGGEWRLELAPGGDEAADADWRLLASGTGAASGTLATLDPTVLLNGIWAVRLISETTGGTAASQLSVTLDKNLKLGHFAVAFNDLVVPTTGLPIQLLRSYDSRDSRVGDFGRGWHLALADVRVEKTTVTGRFWEEIQRGSFAFPIYCLQTTRSNQVTVTFPTGKVYRFETMTDPECQPFAPIETPQIVFKPLPGTRATLAVDDTSPTAAVRLANYLPGPVTLVDSDGSVYNPRDFRLTSEDGTVYRLRQGGGVRSITDRSGNTLTITQGGITSTDASGAPSGRGVTFVRNAQGLIEHILDPNGNSLDYTYDADGNLARFTDRSGNQTTFAYDALFGLQQIEDARGVNVLTNGYGSDGRLAATQDADGRAVSFTYDLANRRESVTDRLGRTTVYESDADGNVTRVTDALGHVTEATFDENDNKLTETDALGHTTTWTYDSDFNKTSETDALGNTTRFTHGPLRDLLTTTDPLGNVTTNERLEVAVCGQAMPSGNLLATVDALGNRTRYTYVNCTGQVQTTTDPRGGVTSYAYDQAGRVQSTTDALGHTTSYSYDGNGNQLSETRTRVVDGVTETLVTTYAYDGSGRRTQVTYPDGTITHTVYNALGKVSESTDQLGRVTRYAYDEQGRLTTTAFPDAATTGTTYDANGRRASSTDREGRTTSYEYDAAGRLTKTTFADGSSRSSAYDAVGRVQSSLDELGHATSYEYDAAGRRTKVTDALGNATTFAYDAAGNQLSVTDALGHTVTSTYDAANRVVRTTYPDGTHDDTEYDAAGNRSAKVDQAGVRTQYGYDPLGRLTSVTDPLAQVTSYGYDELGNRLSQTDANGHTTSFAYDALGRRRSRTLPLGETERFTYFADGQLKSRTDFNGRTTTFAYDSSGRLTTRTPDAHFLAAGEPAVSWTYWPSGRRHTMSDATGVTSYVYDARDRLVSKATPEGTLSYTYDAAGNRTTVRSDSGAYAVDYGYDALNRLSTVTDKHPDALAATGNVGQVTAYHYDLAGRLHDSVYPNGVATTWSYDELGRITNITTAHGATALASYTYGLGPTGNRRSVAEVNGRSVTWDYDGLYRLTTETIAGAASANGVIGYAYDPVGNRLSRTSTVPGIAAQAFTYDADDRLNSDAWDANGNTLASATSTYGYDSENRLVSLNASGAGYLYDGDGQLVRRTVVGVATTYLVDDQTPAGYTQIAEERVGGVVAKSYVFGPQRISMRGAEGVRWYAYDAHSGVRGLLDVAGVVTDTYEYDAFGNVVARTGATENPFTHRGEQVDSTLALQYLRARWMDAGKGRFGTRDTFEGHQTTPGSAVAYSFAGASPIAHLDPSGHDFTLTDIAMAGAIAGGLAANVGYRPQTFKERVVTTLIGAAAGAAVFVAGFAALAPTAAAGAAATAGTVGAGASGAILGSRLVQSAQGLSLPQLAEEERVFLGQYGGTRMWFNDSFIEVPKAGLQYLLSLSGSFGGRVLDGLRGWESMEKAITDPRIRQIVFNIDSLQTGGFTWMELQLILGNPDLMAKTVWIRGAIE